MRRTGLLLSGLVVAVLGAGCSTPDSGVEALGPAVAPPSAPTSEGVPTVPGTDDPGTTTPAGEPTGREVLASVGPSLVFVETPFGTGNGLVVDGRYVVTNLHVVEPFGLATVTVGGTERVEDVPVVGVDVSRDLALLGPLDTDAPSVSLEAPSGLAAGDELYLVGYPGEISATPEPTISRGILSQVRDAPGFEQTYLQTDAAIAGGQSGGALVDGQGRVIGISGLSFGEGNFALALAGDDVAEAVAAIEAGGGDRYRAIPERLADTAGTIELAGPEAEQLVILRNDGDEVVWRLGLDPATSPALAVIDDFGEPLFLNEAAIARAARQQEVPLEEYRATLTYDTATNREVAPGQYEITVPAGAYALAFVGSDLPGPTAMDWSSTPAVFLPPDDDEGADVSVGGSLEGVVEYVESYDTVGVELEAGVPVVIAVRSAVGDPSFELAGPGETFDEGVFVDDADEGLFGLDAVTTYTPTVSGRHRIRIASVDGLSTAWRLTVDPA